jgi:aspartokinase/homoserine dehydrogenase 1
MANLVMKFGGTSVGTPPALSQVISIVLHEHKRWDHLILVASALDGVTDSLLEAAYLAQAANHRGYRRLAATLRTRHISLVEQLPLGQAESSALQADIDQLLLEMLEACQTLANAQSETLSPAVSDSICSVGERLAARIIASLLRQNDLRSVALDGTDILVTNDVHGNATPLLPETRQRIQHTLIPMLNRGIIPVVTGYIGATEKGATTTIGRGGSDYTASILAISTGAQEVWIWSGVDGMMSADPREIPEARVIAEMSYNEVAELAYFGARILHARMIAPLREHNIPLIVRNVYKPQLSGTRIHANGASATPHIKAVTLIQGVGLFADCSGSLARVTQVVDDTLFETVGTHADVMIASQSSARSFLCFVVPTSVGSDAIDTIRAALHTKLRASDDTAVWQVRPVALITAIGEQIDSSTTLIASVMNALSGLRILGTALGPSHCTLSVIVEVHDAEVTLQRLHHLTLTTV